MEQQILPPEELLQQVVKQLGELGNQKHILENQIKSQKMKEAEPTEKNLRIKSKNNSKANKLIRVSGSFAKKISDINDRREENGFDLLSGPKITELITKHKTCWYKIEQDIINFNTLLDNDENGEEFVNDG